MDFYPDLTDFVLKNINDINRSEINIERIIDSDGNRSEVFNVYNKYFIKKVAFHKKDFKAEIEALEVLKDFPFAPKVFGIDQNIKCILMEYLQGYKLIDYFEKYNEIPNNLLQDYYGIKIEMIKLGYEDNDPKFLGSLIWKDHNTSAKKFDYGLCNKWTQPTTVSKRFKEITEEYDKLKKGDTCEWDKLRKTLHKYCISDEAIDKLIAKTVAMHTNR